MFDKNKGMSLIEVIVSIALIGVISVSILPMFVMAIKSNSHNEVKMNALNLAYSQIEWVKGLDYEDIGLKEEKFIPYGIIIKDKYMNADDVVNINGVDYFVTTNISWKNEESVLEGKIANAIKKIEVTVCAKSKFNNEKKEYAHLDTLITYEHERKHQELGYLNIYTYKKNCENPLQGMKIRVTQNNGREYVAYTDRNGSVTFGDLKDGEYVIVPEIENQLLIFEPTEVVNNTYVSRAKVKVKGNIENKEVFFYGEEPVYLKLDREYPEDFLIWLKPNENSVESGQNQYLKINKKLNDISNTNLWWKWIYNYGILQKDTNNEYFLMDKEIGELWNGVFQEPTNKAIKGKEVFIAIGMNDLSSFEVINEDDINTVKLNLKFSAPVKGFDNMKFSINGMPIVNNSLFEYEIEEVEDYSKEVNIKIYDKENNLNINEDTIIEILNPEVIEGKYGIKLAPCMNKSVLKNKNGE